MLSLHADSTYVAKLFNSYSNKANTRGRQSRRSHKQIRASFILSFVHEWLQYVCLLGSVFGFV